MKYRISINVDNKGETRYLSHLDYANNNLTLQFSKNIDKCLLIKDVDKLKDVIDIVLPVCDHVNIDKVFNDKTEE